MPRGEFKRIEELWNETPAEPVVEAMAPVVAEHVPAKKPPVPDEQKSRAFIKIKAARELLVEGAVRRIEQMEAAIAQALADKEYDVALENIKWLIDHTPSDEEGNRVIEGSIDRKQVVEGHGAPSIQIGFNLGGVSNKTLPAGPTVIDVTPEKT